MAKSVDWLIDNIDVVNLCDKIDEQTIASIGRRAITGYDTDCLSRKEWEEKTEAGLKVAKQITDHKSFPWSGAANVKFPLIATASIQFAARSYPQIVNGPDIVRAEILGDDKNGEKEARAKRISQHMSWQCLEQMPEWEPDMDQLLHGLPVMGTYFKKTFFDSLYQRNRSIALTPFEVVVNMKHKGTLDTCRRITQKLWLYKNEVIERENAELFVGHAVEYMKNSTNDEEDVQELFLEQHCWYDLDKDGYEEPYIVTVHYESSTVVRIVSNYETASMDITPEGKLIKINKIEYFTKFTFIPSPDGDFYEIGFSHLLGPVNEAMSTLINQLLDAGSLANTGGGFISKGLRWNGGRLTFELGEWKAVDTTGMSLKDSILPLPVREPSNVLFQLLGLLNDTGQKLASVSDAMSCEMPSQNTPATTTLAMIEQGLKVFTAIYKRVFRSLKSEFAKLYRLNRMYMNEVEYFRLLDSQFAVFQKDYNSDDLDVVPVADPSMSSEAQRLARANALMQTMQLNPDPMGKVEILRQYYDAIGAKNIDKLLNIPQLQQQMQNPPPNPDMLKLQLETQKAKDDMQIRLHEMEQKEREAIAKILEIEANVDLIRAKTMETVGKAEAIEPGMQLDQYRAYVDDLKRIQQHDREVMKMGLESEEAQGENGNRSNTEGAAPGMAEPANNQGSPSGPQFNPGATPDVAPERTDLDNVLAGSNGNADYAAVGQDLRSEFAAGNGPQ